MKRSDAISATATRPLLVPCTPGLPEALILMVRVSTEEKFKV